jgi:EAL domain-containing protein (putative c-di-GMP-specific phosphodiesterase class I)
LEELLKHLNTALYEVKHAGGGAYQFYTPEMNTEAHEFIQLESALRKAIEHNELMLYYQPKLDLKKGNINGVEALLRWEHPTLGVIYPDQFLPIAEETGLIMQIGEWALREACKANKSWQDEGYEHISIAINISPNQFAHPDLIKMIKQVLADTDLNPNYLELEINENTIMQDTKAAADILTQLAELGVRITLDHFGTGYTSITYLKQFPISGLKMDKTFIKGLPNSVDNAAICSAFIGLAHNLSLAITAEGVETAEQVQFLAEHDCDMVQGYFLSYPLPAPKIVLQFKKIRDHVFQAY